MGRVLAVRHRPDWDRRSRRGARYATIYPRPTDAQISSVVKNGGYGLKSAGLSNPTFVHGTNNGSAYVDIIMTYSQTLNFAFFTVGPVKPSHTRRAYQV
ncbi:hypothetical protein GRI89_05735 [Altererythrobacter salegens]|uniref:Uncharacterized protein n=1 Tax=Croceibacterium salegens TaxID=1737568 RepID=A0A6I4SUD0_9SPHN|nr:hypothetical protein [Croceibacterium salegens]MXO59038.1 hypothetical protein [Croceibacterium salegens]